MSKVYLLVICLLSASLTGCLGGEDDDEEPLSDSDIFPNDNKKIEEECELVPYGHCSGEDLRRADLSEMNLTGIDLSYADLFDADLEGADLTSANLTGANLFSVDLTSANLTDANLEDADLELAYADGVDLSGAYLKDIDLTRIFLRDADLTGANLEGANLYRTYLRNANLTGANLEGADLEHTTLNFVNLTNTSLKNANLTSANLTGAVLHYTDFTNAIVTDADFTDTHWHQTIWTDGVIYNTNTNLHYGIFEVWSTEGNFAPDPAQDQDSYVNAIQDMVENPLSFQENAQNLSWQEYTHSFFIESNWESTFVILLLSVNYSIGGGSDPSEGPAGTLNLSIIDPNGGEHAEGYEIVTWNNQPDERPLLLPVIGGTWTITISGSGLDGIGSILYSGDYSITVESDKLE